MPTLIDHIRDVPEIAVRLYLGAKVDQEGDRWVVELDGRRLGVTSETLKHAKNVLRALSIVDRNIQTASDVLELRHRAEDIFLTQISEIKGMPEILFVPAGEMASAFYRARIPADVMKENGIAISDFTDSLDLSKALRYKILWFQLVAGTVPESIARKAKEAGLKIVYDVDDRFDVIPEENPAAAIYVDHKLSDVRRMIELADMVTVSTKTLAEALRDHAKKVRVLPNLVPAVVVPRRQTPPSSFTRILWAGSPTHKRDLAIISPPLLKILKERAGKVRFTCFGDRAPDELLEVGQFVDTVKFVPFVDYHETLADIGAHFMIAPLEDSEFNKSKSAIKVLEAGACEYAILCSAVGEYVEVHKAGAPVALSEDDQWEEALNFWIDHPDDVQEAGKSLRDWVREHRCVMKLKARPWMEAARELST